MLIIPAIDLKDGQCVRLKQGLMDDATVFSNSPGEQAAHWLEQGARRLHVVDLNGAFAGKQKNERAIRAIVDALDDEIPIQLGGGIRDASSTTGEVTSSSARRRSRIPASCTTPAAPSPDRSSSDWTPRRARWLSTAGPN